MNLLFMKEDIPGMDIIVIYFTFVPFTEHFGCLKC